MAEAASAAPLSKKLGIRPGFSVLLLNPPAGFEDTIRPLPDAATLTTTIREAGIRTRDLGGTAGTREFGDAVAARVG